jgi:hypothetical protein
VKGNQLRRNVIVNQGFVILKFYKGAKELFKNQSVLALQMWYRYTDTLYRCGEAFGQRRYGLKPLISDSLKERVIFSD